MGLNEKISEPLLILLYLLIAVIVLCFAPGLINAIFRVGRELGTAIGNVFWG